MPRRFFALFAALGLVLASAPARAHDWNAKQIQWQTYAAGLKLARRTHKPIMLVVFTEWCPHCRNYSAVFKDQRIVQLARKFVMIHVDKDQQPDVSHLYAPDGEYIPRTYFLSSKAVLDQDIHAPRESFRYFYDERDPTSVLAGMHEAARRLK